MNKLLIIILCLLAFGTSIILFPDGPTAVLVGAVVSVLAILSLDIEAKEKDFVLKVFYIGLILRILTAVLINFFSLQEFFGPDALFYDFIGDILSNQWVGNTPPMEVAATRESGWGMFYLVASIYVVAGRNPLAVQFLCASLGAATSVVTYVCAREIFSNRRVARVSAVIVAACPSLILWSSQALKDGLIVFFLVLSIVAVLKLQNRFNYLHFLILMISLFGILSLRFYIFYMLVIAIMGCFVIGKTVDPVSLLKRISVLFVLGVALTSLGGSTEKDLSNFNLNKIQNTRQDLARGNAGFGRDLDVSTSEGALLALPVGFLYLMLAPFPWQLGNLRQIITLPEMLLWYASMPLLISGLIYTIKHRLRSSIAILLFAFMLTVAYSLYQGNIGTAYRQRAQIQIFHFMFIAAGYVLWQEKKENKRLVSVSRRNALLKNFRERNV